ncbi:MAG: hypothetical protein P9M13_08020 [Candidatus Ancaeobacter aquaticus]|nr:hypothetical protein [Candidatus Ancaeobacter aquaticus]
MFRLRSLCAAVAFLSVVFMAGCATVEYVGQTYPRTQYVDYYFNQEDIPRDYIVMGKAIASGSGSAIQDNLLAEAKMRGADAILIQQFGKIARGESTDWNSYQRKNKNVKSEHGRENTYVQEISRVEASFLKYKPTARKCE